MNDSQIIAGAEALLASTRRAPILVALCLLAAFSGGCDSDGAEKSEATSPAETENETGDETDVEDEPSPAILLSAFVRTPEGRNIYVGAVKELPEGKLDYSKFLEFTNVDAYTHGGYIFVWDRDSSIMTRFSVDDEMNLIDPERVSMASATPGVGRHVFVSATRAYTLAQNLETFTIWNPKSMELIEVVRVEKPDVEAGLLPTVNPGKLVGDRVIWPIEWFNYDSLKVRRTASLAIASVSSDDAPTFIEDSRCTAASGGHVDEKGDYYVYAIANGGAFAAFGSAASEVRTCILRVRANADDFDPSFIADLKEITGTYMTRGFYHVKGSQYLAYVWDTEKPLPAARLDYVTNGTFKTLLVDVAAKTSEPYPHVVAPLVTTFEFSLDGVAYHQQSSAGSSVGASTDVAELFPDSAPVRFTVSPGNLNAIGRVR